MQFLDDVVANNGVTKVYGYIGGWQEIGNTMFYQICIRGTGTSIWASENCVERVVPIKITV